MKTKDFILIGLSMVVIYLLFKPKEETNPYYLREMKASKYRVDSLVHLINELQTLKYELKDSINSIDSVYTDISKDSLRARINQFRFSD